MNGNGEKNEMNEQELENVSGGASDEALEKAFRSAAARICANCGRKPSGCDHANDLALYMKSIQFIDNPRECLYNRG